MNGAALTDPQRIRVAHDLALSEIQPLTVVHVGQSAAILARSDSRGLLPVTWGDRGLVPGGVAMATAEGEQVGRLLAQVQRSGGTIDLQGWAALPASRRRIVDLRLHTSALDRESVEHLHQLLADQVPTPAGPGLDPTAQRALAPDLATALVAGYVEVARATAARLLGAGPGATPAGDDILVGVLAAMQAAHNAGLLAGDAGAARDRLADWILEHLDATTRASAHDLAAAARGSFSEHVHDLAAALADPARIRSAVAQAQRWGATSGIDQLHGLVAAARAVLMAHLDHHPAAA